MGFNHSERKIRQLAGSHKVNGTDEKKLVRALRCLGFDYKEIYNRTDAAFKQRVIYNLKKGNQLIILTDHEDHWISVVDYEHRHLKVIDPQEKRVKKSLTPKELAKWCLNFNKHTRETYYYGIIILNPNPVNN